MRIALLTEIPAPYRIPLFNALAAVEDVDFLALFLAERDPRHPFYELHADEFRFEWRVLGGRELTRGGRWVVLPRGLLGELRRFRPDVVGVGGWNQPAFVEALAYGKVHRVPVISWVESTARDARRGSGPLELVKRALVRSYSGFFVPGRASAEYLRQLGVPGALVSVAPNAVDATIFGERVAAAREGRESSASCTFLYVGRLDAVKGLDVLLRAFRDVPGELVLAGSGPEEDRLRTLADERVRFLGAVTRDELVRWYAEADVFVLPSLSEPWGMVLNEAASAGLPLVATDGAGAAHDLIEHGVNGFRVPTGDPEALAGALSRLAEDPALRTAAGARSLELSRRFTPEAWAAGVADLARASLRRR